MDLIKKTRDDYNRIAKHFSMTRNEARELEKFRPFICDGQYILDWGCGNGRLLHILDQAKVHYFGLDQSRGQLQMARKQHAAEIKAGKARFFCTDQKDKKFAIEFFDLVFMAAVLHHLPDVKSRTHILKEMHRTMKSTARIIITVWNLESGWAKQKLKHGSRRLKKNDFLIPWKNQAGQVMAMRYYHHFTKLELRRLLSKAGFQVEDMYYSKGNERVEKRWARNLVSVAHKL